METSVTLRRLMAQDLEAYRALRLEGLQNHPDCFGSAYEDEVRRPLAAFAERIEGTWLLGGFRGETLLAMAGLLFGAGAKSRHKATLFGMYVRPEARGSGLGRALVEGLLAHAAGLVEDVQLTVTTTNAPAIQLYVRAGFAVYGLEARALKLGDRYVDELLMTRAVSGR